MQSDRTERGITLIALIITIIVLLILAGISLSLIMGEGGILKRATDAKEKTEEAEEKEKIELAIISAKLGNKGYQELSQTNLKNEIDNMFGTQNAIVTDNGDGTFTVSLPGSKNDYNINSSGVISSINWDDAMKNATAPVSQDEERNTNVIGIGTDGEPVDMDLWEYFLMEDGTYGLNDENALDGTGNHGRSSGYIGEYTNDGRIIGTVPTYISTDGGKTYKEVTSMVHTFYNENELLIAPQIPKTIKNMNVAFYQAVNLTTPPSAIPSSVEDLSYAFFHCEKLNDIPLLGNSITDMQCSFGYTNIKNVNVQIPDTVTNMKRTFEECSNLEDFDTIIPSGVTDMTKIFFNCTRLKNFNSNLPNNLVNMDYAFYGCTQLVTLRCVVPNNVTTMHGAFYGCESLINGPTKIGSSVKNMIQAFAYCPKLEGTMEINASIDDGIVYEYEGMQYKGYQYCFVESCQSGAGLVLLGDCPKLNELRNNNSKISLSVGD